MTSGWGVDATKDVNGVPTSGTTDLDVRKVWGALYTPGLISGARVSTSGSALRYVITSGVVAIKTAEGEAVLAPVIGETKTVGDVTADRTDHVWVQQRFPTVEGDSSVVIGVGPVVPARALLLASFNLTAGNTNTNQAVRTTGEQFSIPYGARLPRLHYWQNQYQGPLSATLIREGYGEFYLPTDRFVKFSYTACVSALNAVGFDDSKYVEHGFLPNLDGNDLVLWSTPGLHQAWQTVYFERTVEVLAGYHTVNIGSQRKSGPGTTLQWYGLQSDGLMRTGAEFVVDDAGPMI